MEEVLRTLPKEQRTKSLLNISEVQDEFDGKGVQYR